MKAQVTFIFLGLYLFIHERHRERQRHRQRQKQAPCREPDVGLDPGTTGSRPEPKAGAKPLRHPGIPDFIYLFMRDTHTHTEAETQAEAEAGSMQGARRGTRSRVSRIRPWAKGGAKPLSNRGCPKLRFEPGQSGNML